MNHVQAALSSDRFARFEAFKERKRLEALAAAKTASSDSTSGVGK